VPPITPEDTRPAATAGPEEPVGPAGTGGSARPKARLLRNRNFSLLLGGQTVSNLGSAVTFLVFPLIAVNTLHASAFAVSVITAASSLSWLVVSLPAGVWADRVRRRPILLGTDLLSVVLLVTVPLAAAWHVLSVVQMVVVSFGLGLANVVFNIAYPAFLPSVIPADRLVEGNGMLEASNSATGIAGPGLGGLLVQAISAPVVLLVDAVSFLVSAAAFTVMRVDEPRPEREPAAGGSGMLAEIRAGLRFVLGNPTIRALTVGVTVANVVFGGYMAVEVVFLARQLDTPAGLIGLLFSVGGFGGIVGSLAAGRLARRLGDVRLLVVSAAFTAVFVLMIPLTGHGAALTWFAVGSVMLTGSVAAFNVCARAAIQRTAPHSMLGRVTASIRVFSRGVLPLGALLAGVIASADSPRTALWVIMSLYLVVPVWMWFSPLGRVRNVADLDPAPEPEAAPAAA
jgi:predicted MFS family arabinose efflux permease